jgi:DNA polymerase-3 subunit delta'
LQKLIISGKINHAYCLNGVSEGAQDAFAMYWSQQLLGNRYTLSQHPDFALFQPTEGRLSIGMDDAQAVRQHLQRRPLLGAYRVAVVQQAELLTTSAANALLKILEEPPAFAVILLSTAAPQLLPATVRSRMQSLHLPALSEAVIRNTLRAADFQNEQISETVSLVQGKFARLMHVLAADGAQQERSRERQFWLQFLSADTAGRDRMIQETTIPLPRVLQTLEELFHESVRLHVGAGVRSAAYAVLDRYSLHELHNRLTLLQQLRVMASQNVNTKMLFEYLNFSL